jgi:hypothetical protein
MVNDVVAKVERVSHRYGKTLALYNVTLDIPAGQMIGTIGPDAAEAIRASRRQPGISVRTMAERTRTACQARSRYRTGLSDSTGPMAPGMPVLSG